MLDRYLKKQRIFLNPLAKDREELLEFLTHKAMSQDLISDQSAMIEGLKEKESLGIMELKPHVVLPHARGNYVKELFMNLVVAPKGIVYPGAKKNLAKIVLMIGIPEEDQTYLRLLAMISRLLIKDKLVEEMLRAHVVEDLLFTLKKFKVQIRAEKETGPQKYMIWLSLNREVEEEKITALLAEVGVSLGVEIDGTNLGNASVFLPFISSFGFSGKNNKRSRIFTGLSDDPRAASELFNLLKQEGIDLSEKGVGLLFQMKTMEAYGGVGEDLDF